MIDVKVTGKSGYIMDARATVGLSGDPMLDSSNNSVIGLCFMGLPEDAHEKTQIGALDIRQFPFHLDTGALFLRPYWPPLSTSRRYLRGAGPEMPPFLAALLLKNKRSPSF